MFSMLFPLIFKNVHFLKEKLSTCSRMENVAKNPGQCRWYSGEQSFLPKSRAEVKDDAYLNRGLFKVKRIV